MTAFSATGCAIFNWSSASHPLSSTLSSTPSVCQTLDARFWLSCASKAQEQLHLPQASHKKVHLGATYSQVPSRRGRVSLPGGIGNFSIVNWWWFYLEIGLENFEMQNRCPTERTTSVHVFVRVTLVSMYKYKCTV